MLDFVDIKDRGKFLARCRQHDIDPVDALCHLSLDHPLVVGFLRVGVSNTERQDRHAARKLVKAGRASEITDANLRAEEEAWVAHSDDIGTESATRLLGKIAEQLRQFEDTLYCKWIIGGKTALGEATPEMLIAAAVEEEASAEGHVKNAKFYRGLASMGKPGLPLILSVSVEAADSLRADIFDEVESM